MRNGLDTAGGWRVAAVMALMLAAPCAWADAGNRRADGLCEQAERAERAARDAERKSVERERFLKGKGGIAPSGGAAPTVNRAAMTQEVRARIAEARAMLPQLRQGVAAANQDRGVVPGLSRYFSQMESNIGAALQSAEMCLNAPDSCSAPAIVCPYPPNIPVYGKNNASADFIRQVQASYRQSANAMYQACQNLSAATSRDVDRLRQESRAAAMQQGAQGSGGERRFGDTDLYLKRAESLKREAAQHRLEADSVSGIEGYCRAPQRARPGADDQGQAVVDALKAADARKRKAAPDPGPAGTVIDLKAGWGRPWDKGRGLSAEVPPLPKAEGGAQGETGLDKARDYLSEKGQWWWYKAKSWYRDADEQVELTEFIKSRPKELVKDVVTELVEKNCGSFGKSLTTGYKILGAVKSTSDEVGEILVDAPAVIAYGSEADARELSGRADRAPVKFLNDLFDDVTGKFPPPRYKYEYKAGVAR